MSSLTLSAADPELSRLIQEELSHLLDDASTDNTHDDESLPTSNVYFDKQLNHLVLSEEFNFFNISKMMTVSFRESKVDTSEKACKERWSFLHKNRENLKEIQEKQKENKRAKSVAAFSNPYSLYSVDELIENLENSEKKENESTQLFEGEPVSTGYNIFKDSFRKITNLEEYKTLEEKMQEALKKAQEEVYEDKPLFFTPEYGKMNSFEVKSEELTEEKMKQIMAYRIEIEKIGKELTIKKDEDEEKKYEEIIKKRVEKEERRKKIDEKGQELDENWDEYESD